MRNHRLFCIVLVLSFAASAGAQSQRAPVERFTIDVPILRLHGWPSTFVQMLDIIPLLTDLFPRALREFGERLLNVEHGVDTDVGGHFFEWEEPELVARDMQAFFGRLPR